MLYIASSVHDYKIHKGKASEWLVGLEQSLQAVTYTVKVVVSKKWRETDTLLLHTTNRKYHMAYLFVPFPMTLELDDFEGHSTIAGLIKCNSTNICATFSTVLTDMARRGSIGDSWASCRDIADYLSKVADFDQPHLHLASPAEFRGDLWHQKTRSLCYRVVLFMWSYV